VFVAVSAAGGMTFTPMETSTVFGMVVLFGLLMVALGVKHEEYRAPGNTAILARTQFLPV
jgi:hypothetical protein